MKRAAAGFLRTLVAVITAFALFISVFCGCGNDSRWAEAAPEPMFSAPIFVTPNVTQAPSQRKGDGVLTLNYASDFSMNPFITQSETNLLLSGLLYEPMISVTPGFHAEPGLLAEWSVEAGVLFKFKLRSGARFSDGTDVRNWDVL